MIPTLRDAIPSPREYAGSTCYEAGYLVEKNAGWRQVRPVVDTQACTGCLQCYLYCPDGCIRKVDAAEGAGSRRGSVRVDYDFCKGCGICASVCKFAALAILSEKEALRREAAATSAAGATPSATERSPR